eukprot:CAMPEP_0170560780 /NCGR_PEP_ID=MMETSP0211-20121228/50961_1 /TAXON_ID=311385 /ORGANISM="Pseudokeronopsis sp., Strain OXSARD2" /LENGTH=37 /DNA_ID= /DNA_START= /DNA_END= /DNA_ORIENTATION=
MENDPDEEKEVLEEDNDLIVKKVKEGEAQSQEASVLN